MSKDVNPFMDYHFAYVFDGEFSLLLFLTTHGISTTTNQILLYFELSSFLPQ